MASSTVGDIAVMVRQTRMLWKEFDPGNGDMSAEGRPHVSPSSKIPGVGLVL